MILIQSTQFWYKHSYLTYQGYRFSPCLWQNPISRIFSSKYLWNLTFPVFCSFVVSIFKHLQVKFSNFKMGKIFKGPRINFLDSRKIISICINSAVFARQILELIHTILTFKKCFRIHSKIGMIQRGKILRNFAKNNN